MRYGPWAVIAGASHGTGVAYAQAVAGMGINVMLVALTVEELQPVAADVTARHGVQTRLLAQDLMELEAAANMLKASADLDVGLYISNAGSRGTGGAFFFERPVEMWRGANIMNVVTVMEAVHGFGSRFLKRGRGGIIVMSSNAALRSIPNMAVYSATKGYEMQLVEALCLELYGTNVDILASLCPAMDTPPFREGTTPEVQKQPTGEVSKAAGVQAEQSGRYYRCRFAADNREVYF
jgi:short-subunit dehydrogenase